MLKKIKDFFRKASQAESVYKKNRQRFDNIISDNRFNYLESIYKRLFNNDTSLTDTEILEGYFKFSDSIQTNTIAAAELEWVVISVVCHFRPGLTATLTRKGLLTIVYSLGDGIDWFTVRQFLDQRILAEGIEPYGGLPPDVGLTWLKDVLPQQKEIVQSVLEEVIIENRKELDNI